MISSSKSNWAPLPPPHAGTAISAEVFSLHLFLWFRSHFDIFHHREFASLQGVSSKIFCVLVRCWSYQENFFVLI